MRIHLTLLCCMLAVSTNLIAQTPRLGVNSIEEVVAAMTLEEKVNMVMGNIRDYAVPPTAAPGLPVRQAPDIAKLLKDMATHQNTPLQLMTAYSQGRVMGASGDGYAVERLGITPLVYADGPSGVRITPVRPQYPGQEFYCTAFPTSTLSASWDPALVERMTTALGEEVKEYGVDVLLAPAINIIRNPLGGRSFEYFSEDPYLAGKMATAYVNGVQSNGVGVSVKHFAINNQETYRNGINVFVSERAAREIYLKAFEMVVREAQPWTLMSSYNRINGVFASESEWLLNKVLRDEWGFKGIVMTDWWAEEDGARQVSAGNDLLMPGTQHQYDELMSAIRSGRMDERLLDKAVANILRITMMSPTFKGYKYSNKPDLAAHAKVARETAPEGMVLLENNGALPFGKKVKKVALFGVGSYDTNVGGSGSGDVNKKYKVSLDEGLANAGYKLLDDLGVYYRDYIAAETEILKQSSNYGWSKPIVQDKALDKTMVEAAAKKSDIAVLTIGRMAGEGGDRQLEKGDWYLTDAEMDNLKLVCDTFHACGKKVVVLLNMGNIIDMNGWNNLPDAILHTWLPGQEAGNAMADVLSGKVNPSGKLPFTVAAKYEDYPSAANFPYSNGNEAEVCYDEDIFVGYRHFDTFGVEPLYPFGYGLSYTSFDYSGLTVTPAGDGFDVTVTVKNTGKVAGKESVQIYVSAPANPHMPKPEKELKAFGKTGLLKPGASETLHMHISRGQLASWNALDGGWIVDSGSYTFMAGASSRNILLKETVHL